MDIAIFFCDCTYNLQKWKYDFICYLFTIKRKELENMKSFWFKSVFKDKNLGEGLETYLGEWVPKYKRPTFISNNFICLKLHFQL